MTQPFAPLGPADAGAASPASFSPRVWAGLDAAAAGCAISLIGLVHLETGGVARLLLALAFVSFVPGWALLDHVPLAGGWSRIALAVAISLTVCTAAATAMAWLEWWRPSVLLDVVGGLSVLAILVQRAPRR